MFPRLASRVRLLAFEARLVVRNLECQRLARFANRHEEYIELLLQCIAHEYGDASEADFGYEWHTQPLPGYCMKGEERTSEICWEAPVCYTIHLYGKPLVGMAVEFHGKMLRIRQLQGQPGASIPPELRKWPALFLRGAKNFLNNTKDFTSLRLYAADQRVWYSTPVRKLTKEELRQHQQGLRRRYDGTARQEGFKKTKAGYFVWDLSMHKKSKS